MEAQTPDARIMFQAENKTALVTGASRGIGRATALALASAGARVLVHYGQSATDAEEVVSLIRSKGGAADALSFDLSTPQGAKALAEQARALADERLDIIVLNAGVSKSALLSAYEPADLDRLFSTNVYGPFFLVQQLESSLRKGSSIVAVTSAAAHMVIGRPTPDVPSILGYASTKGALEVLVKNWAAMLGPRGIRVNAVAPGIIDTEMSNFTKTDAGREIALSLQALKRIAKPEDVADVIVFLTSDASRWITGATIPVDGGSRL